MKQKASQTKSSWSAVTQYGIYRLYEQYEDVDRAERNKRVIARAERKRTKLIQQAKDIKSQPRITSNEALVLIERMKPVEIEISICAPLVHAQNYMSKLDRLKAS